MYAKESIEEGGEREFAANRSAAAFISTCARASELAGASILRLAHIHRDTGGGGMRRSCRPGSSQRKLLLSLVLWANAETPAVVLEESRGKIKRRRVDAACHASIDFSRTELFR